MINNALETHGPPYAVVFVSETDVVCDTDSGSNLYGIATRNDEQIGKQRSS